MTPARQLVALLAVLSLLPASATATILTFDETRSATGATVVPTIAGASVPQDYGDRVTGSVVAVPGGQFTYGDAGEGFTSNVTTEYLAASGANLWTTQYGDLLNVLFARAPVSGGGFADTLGILFEADPGFEVQLHQFDLAGFPNTDYVIAGVSVLAGSSTLFSQNNVLVEGDFGTPRRTEFNFASPLTAASLLVEIDFSNLAGGIRDNIGIDNIRFGQVPPPSPIPLPSAFWLFGAALIGFMSLSRRRNP